MSDAKETLKRKASPVSSPPAHRVLTGLTRSISPPPLRRQKLSKAESPGATLSGIVDLTKEEQPERRDFKRNVSRESTASPAPVPVAVSLESTASPSPEPETNRPKLKSSTNSFTPSFTDAADSSALNTSSNSPIVPFTLTHIQDLPPNDNTGSTTLSSLIGDPLVRELWVFNYCIDLDFVMGALDPDIRHAVKVYIVHGSWKRDSETKIRLEQQQKQYPNVNIRIAYMPEPFGTHHTKIFVCKRADDTAELVIHTANMIPFDWGNMCQAVWRSGPLELQVGETADEGVGNRFKKDVLAYFSAYGKSRTGELVEMLGLHDFSHVKAVFVGSVPSRETGKKWGWPKLKEELAKIPSSRTPAKKGHVVIQISSIATVSDKWFRETLLTTLNHSRGISSRLPVFSVVYPRVPEIRASLNGWRSGNSVHTKVANAGQKKQADNLRKYFCGWTSSIDRKNGEQIVEGGRSLAAPHIKTYIRYADAPGAASKDGLLGKPEDYRNIEWALVTSANLSTQAWGAAPNANGKVRICSWEAGVLVYPALWSEEHKMKGYYANEQPSAEPNTVSIRVPYDVPLRKYADGEMPWSPGESYSGRDQFGLEWI